MNLDELRQYAELALRKRKLDAERREINDQLDALRPRLLDQFETEQVTRLTLDGIGTCYLHETGWVKVREDVSYGQAVAALKAAGLGDYVAEKFNSQSLSALWREWRREGGEPPARLEDTLDFAPQFDIRVRKS